MMHNGAVIGKRDDLVVIDCRVCGYAHLLNTPSEAELQNYYAKEFWQHTKHGAQKHIVEQLAWWNAIYGDWLSLCEQHTAGRFLLDVGSGYGYFMLEAQRRGWTAWGIEPSAHAYAVARGEHQLNVTLSAWSDISPRNTCDCIAALWLIEHLPNPLDFLRWSWLSLKPGGVLLAVVPNDFSAAQHEANSWAARPYWWIDQTHLNYFTWSSFSNLLGMSEFRIIERQTMYPMEQFIRDGRDYTANDEVGRKAHQQVEHNDFSMTSAARLEQYGELARLGRGREIVVVAVKE